MTTRLDDLETPALVLDLDRLEANLDRMAARCERLGVALRPHVKTHKCLEIGRLQLQRGASGITVATLDEARSFAEAGFDDITWALPIPISRIPRAVRLARRIEFGLLVDSKEAVQALEVTGEPLRVLLKVDCGYHRAGVDPESESALGLARLVAQSKRLTLDGILTHSGQAYRASGPAALAAVAEHERQVMASFADRLRRDGIDVRTVSVGSTPAMSAVGSLDGVTEARPGNYAFFDAMQVAIGSCTAADCALSVISSVVSSQKEHSILDAGALSLSKDAATGCSPRPLYAQGSLDYPAGSLDPTLEVFAVSQEHGWVTGRHRVGERVRLLPHHSCLTAAQFDHYAVVRDERVVDRWPILRRRD